MADYNAGTSVRSRSRSRSPPPRDFAANSDRPFLNNGQNNYEEGAGDSGGGGQPHSSVALYVGNLDYGEYLMCYGYRKTFDFGVR